MLIVFLGLPRFRTQNMRHHRASIILAEHGSRTTVEVPERRRAYFGGGSSSGGGGGRVPLCVRVRGRAAGDATPLHGGVQDD